MKRIAAVDPGEKRVGLAVSDELKLIARTLPCLDASGPEETAKNIARSFGDFEIEEVLIGRPKHQNGAAGNSATRSEALAEELRKLGFKVRLVDERLSTVEAARRLHEAGLDTRKQRPKIDSAAAAVILQSYIDLNPRWIR